MSAFELLETLEAELEESGIRLRGVLRLGAEEKASLALPDEASSVVLLGNVGGSIWPAFSAWRGGYDGDDPLDAWSKAVVAPIAGRLGATAFYPSDPPYMPFQRWAMRPEGLKASPLGILIHPEYGLWHGYRAALVFREEIAVSMPPPRGTSPCDTCTDRPCLRTCPAGAISPDGFAVAPCRQHLAGEKGQAGCMAAGCVARNACPVGADYRYSPEQLRFHMAALLP